MNAGTTVTDPSIFITIAWVMTIGIAAGLVFVPFITKKDSQRTYQGWNEG